MKWAGTIWVICILTSCDLLNDNSTPVCDPLGPHPRLKLIATEDATNCLQPDGKLIVEATGGLAPYRFTLDEEKFSDTGQFTGLFAGDYKVKVVDAAGCFGFVSASVGAAGNVFSAAAMVTPDNACFSNNGSITVVAKNGQKPFQYTIKPEGGQRDSVFSGLEKGYYRISVTDAEKCKTFLVVVVPHGFTGVSYTNDISPIIAGKCSSAGCHNGDTGGVLNFLIFSNVRSFGPRIKTMVNLRRPHYQLTPLHDQEIQFINCWVDDGTRQN